jgi:hypothetical protein
LKNAAAFKVSTNVCMQEGIYIALCIFLVCSTFEMLLFCLLHTDLRGLLRGLGK